MYAKVIGWGPLCTTFASRLAQLNTTVGDFEGNRELILDAGRRGAEADADLVVYPELALTGYPPEDLLIRGRSSMRRRSS